MNKAINVYDVEKCHKVCQWKYGMPEEVREILEDQGYMLREDEFR